jgi:beta-lactam-binding protein with PASTA domain
VLGIAAAVLVLGFLALFASGGSGEVSGSGSLPALTTTTTRPTSTTVTTIVSLRALGAMTGKETLVFVTVPNVVGMTLGQANDVLGAVGLGAGDAYPASKPSGRSVTGTILGQSPAAGSKAETGQSIQVAISGY